MQNLNGKLPVLSVAAQAKIEAAWNASQQKARLDVQQARLMDAIEEKRRGFTNT